MATTARPGPAIVTRSLTKRFGTLTAVDDLSVEVPRGAVVGLLGPNGAGKSTIIRMLLALIRPSDGTAEVLGEPVSQPGRFLSRVGALIEAPTFYPSLSGQENLRALAVLEDQPATRVDEVIELLGLAERSTDKFGDYSSGMKQRLGVAAALLPDPELMILDEPTNGLDPAGIVEIRELLRRLSAGGVTVLVSCHLLAEIQAACDHLVIIKRGRLVFAGGLNELLVKARREVHLAPEHEGDAARLIRLLGDAGHRLIEDSATIVVSDPVESTADLNRLATANGIPLRELAEHHESLEDVFLRLTTDEAA